MLNFFIKIVIQPIITACYYEFHQLNLTMYVLCLFLNYIAKLLLQTIPLIANNQYSVDLL